MMKALYIDHTYHKLTNSTRFLEHELATDFDVSYFYIDPALPEDYSGLSKYKGQVFDLVVCFQIHVPKFELMKYFGIKRLIFIPMYDGVLNWKAAEWEQYRESTIINFSEELHKHLIYSGFDSRFYKYFPKPADTFTYGDVDSVFFWQRINQINVGTLMTTIGEKITHLHIHKKLDPGHQQDNQLKPKNQISITESKWFETKDDLIKTIQKSALYFAPRVFEGIGMSFLEAMANGRCVVATNTPTMNEYIRHGETGYLYDFSHPSTVRLDSIREVQNNAYEFIKRGYLLFNEYSKNFSLDFANKRFCVGIRANDFTVEELYQIVQMLKCKFGTSVLVRVVGDESLRSEVLKIKSKLDIYDIELCSFEACYLNFTIVKSDERSHPKHINSKEFIRKMSIFTDVSVEEVGKLLDNNYPKVTVVTVVKDIIKNKRESFLLSCISSVAQQKYFGDIEHLIVDGVSSDGTLDLLKKYQKDFKLRIVSKKDTSIYDAMNNGFLTASGKYIVFLNSDDYFSNARAIELSVDKLEKENADFSFGNYRCVDEHGVKEMRTHELGLFFLRMPFCHQTMFVKASVARTLNYFNAKKYRSAGDYDFVLRVILSGCKGVWVNQELVHFREGGFSANTKISESECLDILESNYKKICNVESGEIMELFYEYKFKHDLFFKIERHVHSSVLYEMNRKCAFFHSEHEYFYYTPEERNKSPFFNPVFVKHANPDTLVVRSNKSIGRTILSKNLYKIAYKVSFGVMRSKFKSKYKNKKALILQCRRENVAICGLNIVQKFSNDRETCIAFMGVPFFSIKR